MARSRQIILKLTGDDRDVKRAVREVREDLRRLSREEVKARIDLDTRIVERKIEAVKADLAKLAVRTDSPEVDLKTQKALRKLDRLNIALDRMKLKRVEVDVDVKRGGLERVGAALGSLDRGGDKFFKGIGDFFRSIPVLGQMLGVAIDGFVELGNSIAQGVTKGVTALSQLVPQLAGVAGPIGTVVGGAVNLALSFGSMLAVGGALIIALNAVLGAVIALAGAFVALAASAAAALGGLLALGVAFGAALIPALLVGIGVMTRFVALMKARQAQQQEMTQATQAAKTAEEAHTRALEQRKQAEQQLAEATVAGRQAAAQAIRDERDAELGLLNTKNGVADARLQLALAKRDLKDFLKQADVKHGSLDSIFKRATDVSQSPAQLRSLVGEVAGGSGKKKIDPLDLRQKLQAVRDAQLGVMNATNGVTNAEERLADVRSKEADFAKRGLRAYGPYRQALTQVARANAAVAKSAKDKTAAESKYEQALKKLTPTEKTTLSNLDKFLAGFEKLAKAVSDPVFKALNGVFGSLSKSGVDLAGALKKIGEAMGDVVRSFGAFLLEPRTQSAFKTMAAGAADLTRELGAHAFRSFLQIMREVAVSALPAVQSAAHGVSTWLARIAGQPGRIHRAVGFLVGQFKIWSGLVGAIGKFLLAVFPQAARSGGDLAGWLTKIVNKWTKWIHENPKEVRKFFDHAVKKTKEIVTWLAKAFVWLGTNLPKAARTAHDVLSPLVTVFKTIYKTVKAIVDLLHGNIKGAAKDLKDSVLGVVKDSPVGSAIKAFGDLKHGHPGKAGKDLIPLPGPLKKILFGAGGGLVPGQGSADTQPAMLMPGEFILRKGIVKSLGLPFLNALNAGAAPAAVGAAAGGRGGDIYHIHVQPLARDADPDPVNTVALIQQALESRGGIR